MKHGCEAAFLYRIYDSSFGTREVQGFGKKKYIHVLRDGEAWIEGKNKLLQG